MENPSPSQGTSPGVGVADLSWCSSNGILILSSQICYCYILVTLQFLMESGYFVVFGPGSKDSLYLVVSSLANEGLVSPGSLSSCTKWVGVEGGVGLTYKSTFHANHLQNRPGYQGAYTTHSQTWEGEITGGGEPAGTIVLLPLIPAPGRCVSHDLKPGLICNWNVVPTTCLCGSRHQSETSDVCVALTRTRFKSGLGWNRTCQM